MHMKEILHCNILKIPEKTYIQEEIKRKSEVREIQNLLYNQNNIDLFLSKRL